MATTSPGFIFVLSQENGRDPLSRLRYRCATGAPCGIGVPVGVGSLAKENPANQGFVASPPPLATGRRSEYNTGGEDMFAYCLTVLML
jgi:hypothetical protein